LLPVVVRSCDTGPVHCVKVDVIQEIYIITIVASVGFHLIHK
jgi:hypothetical protein